MDRKWFSVLKASHIAETFFCFEQGHSAQACHDALRERGYDVGGVRDESRGVVGYVELSDLQGATTCGDAARAFSVGELVPGDVPLINLFRGLATEREHFFILGHGGVERILTRADLNKQPVKAMLFSLVCELEQAMTLAIRHAGLEVEAMLSDGRVGTAKELQEMRREKKQELDLVECLNLCDKFTMLHKAGLLREWFPSGNKMESCATKVETLRNNLAHAHDPENGLSWGQIADIVDTMMELEAGLS